jgi:hypothetical protein
MRFFGVYRRLTVAIAALDHLLANVATGDFQPLVAETAELLPGLNPPLSPPHIVEPRRSEERVWRSARIFLRRTARSICQLQGESPHMI